MSMSDRDSVVRLERQFVPLLVTVLLPIMLLPQTATGHRLGDALLALVVSLLILQSIRTLGRAHFRAGLNLRQRGYACFGLFVMALLWIPVLRGSWQLPAVKASVLVSLSLFFLITSVRLVRLLARVPRVNAQVMAGAAAGYLLLGFTGGVLATATEVYQPGSFLMGHLAHPQLLLDRLTYYSFITIAGLGYGDVVPGNAIGERFAILLSVSSTLYVALLVGLLMGRFIASQEVLILEEDGVWPEARPELSEGGAGVSVGVGQPAPGKR
ncbi:MAG: potassium channel family protein [Cyanobium sp.]